MERLPTSTVRSVLAVLGEPTLRLVSDPAGLDLAVSQVVLHDPRDRLGPASHGMLLGVGVDPAGDDLEPLLMQAAEHGLGVVAVKAYDVSLTDAVAAADRAGVALVVVADQVDWLQLERLVSTAIAGSGASRPLALSSLAVGDLFSLANAIATATGGATAIEDLARRVLAYSTVAGQIIDDERREGILGRQVPDHPPNDEQYHRLYTAPGVVRFPPDPGALPRVACAVRAGRDPLGSIWLVDQGRLAPDTDHLLVQAAEVAALHLLRSRSDEDFVRQQRTDLVRRLIEGSDPAAAARLGIPDGTALSVLAVEPPSDAPLDMGRLLDVVTLELQARVGPTGCLADAGRIYAVLTGTRVSPDRMPAVAADVLRSSSASLRLALRAGVGAVVEDAREIGDSRRQADLVLTLLAGRPDLGDIRTAAEVADDLVLLQLGRQHQDVAGLSAVAASVLAHDRDHGTAYASLLLNWCDRGRDVRAVAEALSLHPNTVRYRLGRARELFGLDPEHPAQVLLLWLALRLEVGRGGAAGGTSLTQAGSGRPRP